MKFYLTSLAISFITVELIFRYIPITKAQKIYTGYKQTKSRICKKLSKIQFITKNSLRNHSVINGKKEYNTNSNQKEMTNRHPYKFLKYFLFVCVLNSIITVIVGCILLITFPTEWLP